MNDELLTRALHEDAYITEERLSEILDERKFGNLCGAMRYSALGGGKRLRAFLTLEFSELCGGKKEDALDYACALEMMHAFSLIHDDLPAMDNDVLRRGKPTSHIAFGEATAILAGDALAIDCFGVIGKNKKCSSSQNLEAINTLSSKAGANGMCDGQKLDIDGEGKETERQELERLVDRKTGDLFAAGCLFGCIAAKAGAERKKAADRFGHDIGRAFQITDDLLDIHSTPEELGKSVGKDEKEEKSTFASLLGEKEAKRYAEFLIREAKTELKFFDDGDAKKKIEALCDYILIRKK